VSVAAELYRRTVVLMSTCVTIQVVTGASKDAGTCETREAVERAFDWFRRVEECCSRFNPHSELMELSSRADLAVPATPLLYEAVSFAIAVAEETGGAFDPTVGRSMEARGFNREYRTGATVGVATTRGGAHDVSYRDVRLDPERQTITLLRPMTLDLGAVAKGLAIDMAARELGSLANDYAIDAGGDIYAAGHNPDGKAWTVGIRHPRRDDQLLDTIRISNAAVCTSGDYERRSRAEDGEHHIIDPRTGRSPDAVASVTVIAPTAMAADALATAAFVLRPAAGIEFLERQGVNGLIVSSALQRFSTHEMPRVY
jgi:thiamine biosynthesis lipoprotein